MQKLIVAVILHFSIIGYSQNKLDIFFDFNKDNPNQVEMSNLNNWMKSNSNVEIISMSGFCDSVDSNDYNKKLATRRINSVVTILKNDSIFFNENLKINTVGEDFEQSKIQAENRKVTIEYIEKTKSTIKSPIQIKTEPVILTPEDIIENERISLFNQFEKAKIGDKIAIYNIQFVFNSEELIPISEPLLEELLFVMERNPNMVIKIYGHMCCNPNIEHIKLSSRRALKIVDYLTDNGVQRFRLNYTGVGTKYPIYPIPEKNEEEKLANRRVEIEIIAN